MAPLLIVDSNEAATNAGVVRSLERHFGSANVKISKLTAGDISIPLNTGLLLIERKTPGDLLGSIGDGRVFEQVERMAMLARFSAVVIHGSLIFHEDGVIANGRRTKWNSMSVQHSMWAMQWAGSAVVVVPEGAYPQTVEALIHLAEKPKRRAKRERAITFPPMDPRVEFMCGIPGLGPIRSEMLMEWVGQNIGIPEEKVTASQMLSWATFLHRLPPGKRPHQWGDAIVEKIRSFMALKQDEYIAVTHMPVEEPKEPKKKGGKRDGPRT